MLSLLALALSTLAAQPVEMPKPNYCFGFLKAAPNRPDLPKQELERIQAAHMAHLGKLAAEGWLLAAGPMGGTGVIRGILISKCASLAEAVEKASADPAVKAGRLVVEAYRWTGPEGIGEGYRKRREQQPDAQDKMAKHAMVIVRKGQGWKIPPEPVVRAHMAYLESQRKNGLAAIGPFHDSPEILGVVIYRNTTLEEARSRTSRDPMFQSGVELEALDWWCAEGVLPD